MLQQLGEEVQVEVEELEDLPWGQEQGGGVGEWMRAWRDVLEGWEGLLPSQMSAAPFQFASDAAPSSASSVILFHPLLVHSAVDQLDLLHLVS